MYVSERERGQRTIDRQRRCLESMKEDTAVGASHAMVYNYYLLA